MNQRFLKYYPMLWLMLGLLSLTACTILPEQDAPPRTHMLEWQGEAVSLSKPSFNAIQINAPASYPAYDTAAMAYRRNGHELRHYAANRWADKPARLIGAAITEAISDARLARDVAPPGSRIAAAHRLDSELIRLEQVFDDAGSHIRLTIRYRLIDQRSGESLGRVRHDLTVASEQDDPDGGVVAANEALADSLKQLTANLPGWL